MGTPFGNHVDGWLERLSPALSALQKLTELRILDPPQSATFPPALTALGGLKRLMCTNNLGPPADPRLPSGPWLVGLRRLVLDADAAAASLEVLAPARNLTTLRLVSFSDDLGAGVEFDNAGWAAHERKRRAAEH